MAPPTPTPTPIFTGWLHGRLGGSLLFGTRSLDGEHRILAATLDGKVSLVSFGDLIGGQPWSPDGMRLIVANGRFGTRYPPGQLVIADLEEGVVSGLRLGGVPSLVFWSPDSKYLLYALPAPGPDLSASLVLYEFDTGARTVLTQPSRVVSVAGWSPDGLHVAFVSDLKGQFDLYSVSMDDHELHQLTDDPAIEAEAHWSPSNGLLLFGTLPTQDIPPAPFMQVRELYLVDRLGGEKRLLGDSYYETPALSPDGDYVAFSQGCICTLEIESGRQRCPLQDTELRYSHCFLPAWSLDGAKLAFRASQPDDPCYRAYVLDLSSGELVEAEADGCNVSPIYWVTRAGEP